MSSNCHNEAVRLWRPLYTVTPLTGSHFLLPKYDEMSLSADWLFLPRGLDCPVWMSIILPHARVFFRLLLIFLAAFLSYYEFSESVLVYVCVGLHLFGHYIGINGLVVRLAIWNRCDSAVLHDLWILFPDPACMAIHMTWMTVSTYSILEQIIYWFIYSVFMLFVIWQMIVAHSPQISLSFFHSLSSSFLWEW